jgi:hypothetical protein
MSRFILAQVADQFCDLLTQEKGAIEVHLSEGISMNSKKYFIEIIYKNILFKRQYNCLEKSGPRCSRDV